MKFNKAILLIAGLSLLLLGGSAALNFLLYGQLKKYYTELSQVRLDPLGLSYYDTPSNSTAFDARQKRVVFWGDSRAAGWPAPDIAGYDFVNRGVGSQTSIQALKRFDSHIQPLQPDVVVIQVGINDLKAIPLLPAQQETIVANCRDNIQQMVNVSRSSGAVVVVSTILPAGEVPLERRLVWSDEVGKAVETVNDYIRALADDGVIVFDGYAVLADERGLMQRQHRKDELHLNAQGYEALNGAFVEALTALNQ